MKGSARGRKAEGHAVIEMALFLPWILLLFLAIFDFGFFAYALISVENAARVAALYTSADTGTAADSSHACSYVLDELRTLPNLGSSATCAPGCAAGSVCPAGHADEPPPLSVQATSVTGADGQAASRVAVEYHTIQLFPLPFLTGQLTIRRVVEMKI